MSFRIHPDTLDFELPEQLIAQVPLEKRDHAKLMVLHRDTGRIEHRIFSDLPEYLKPTDLLVLNQAKVSKRKLIGAKPTGGRVEMIFVEKESDGTWRALVRPQLKKEAVVNFAHHITARVVDQDVEGLYRIQADGIEALLDKEGQLPLPPYIKRETNDARKSRDTVEYQTVYAATEGSLAAPTAGLHFTPELLSQCEAKGVTIARVLLHVGWGTFRPINKDVSSHQMLAERYEVPAKVFSQLKNASRVVAVGTTSVRTLESLNPENPSLTGATSLFIKPGFEFQWVDVFITNFHTPRSTPVALTAAFAGLPLLERAYAKAIENNYRFYSYGDAMLII